jgi:hypothetical protein
LILAGAELGGGGLSATILAAAPFAVFYYWHFYGTLRDSFITRLAPIGIGIAFASILSGLVTVLSTGGIGYTDLAHLWAFSGGVVVALFAFPRLWGIKLEWGLPP